jgi:prevent-host-death family protein
MNIADAKARLSSLVEAALNGEDVTLARNGKAMVRLVPVGPVRARRFGLLRDMGWSQELPLELFEPDPEDARDSPLFPES